MAYVVGVVAAGHDHESIFRQSPSRSAAQTFVRYALWYAAEELRSDRKVVHAAVKQHGCALKHAAPELQTDAEIVLAAVKQDSDALVYAGCHLRGDKVVMLVARQRAVCGEIRLNSESVVPETVFAQGWPPLGREPWSEGYANTLKPSSLGEKLARLLY